LGAGDVEGVYCRIWALGLGFGIWARGLGFGLFPCQIIVSCIMHAVISTTSLKRRPSHT
jgi:hypothetical protein